MATSLWQLLGDYKIEIPILQRDFAQGRQTGKVPHIRQKFLEAILSAFSEKSGKLELDFVYGYTKENKNSSGRIEMNFIPLDGQQRLTTLFLLHWFIAMKENKLDEAAIQILKRFTYETRHSSRVFCNKLAEFNPENFSDTIKDTIINQNWFFTAWQNDPTINSMLTMLNDIEQMVSKNDLKGIWPLLISDEPRIVFHLLPMGELGLPDDLYIKMNSRGKELTEFEHFKSRFSEILPKGKAMIFNRRIDQEWSDLFWNLYKDDESLDIAFQVDSAFLRFFKYVTDLLSFRNDIKDPSQFADFDLYKKLYAGDENTENIDFFFSCLNVFCTTYLSNPEFFNSIFYLDEKEFALEKTRLFFQNSAVDLFKKCADNYDTLQRANPFSFGEQLMLYACLLHLINKTSDFDGRIRNLRNLIANSEDTVRKENMPSLLISVSKIIQTNLIGDDSKFNSTQIEEEKIKKGFISQNLELKPVAYKLEDHHLLQGCLAIFSLDEKLEDYSHVFHQIFYPGCRYEPISRALLIFGDYSQKYNQRWRLGNENNSVWRELFTPSQRRGGFQQTKIVVYSLLDYFIQNPQASLEEIIVYYLTSFENDLKKPKDWIYYFIKYSEFRKSEEGFYYWNINDKSKQYECIMMRRYQLNGFNWSPYLYTLKSKSNDKLSLEDYGAPLILDLKNGSLKMSNINVGFRFEANDEDSKILLSEIRKNGLVNNDDLFEIAQNDEGIDLEDRIGKGSELIDKLIKL